MSRRSSRNDLNSRPNTLRRWHRYIGLITAVFVLVLSATGLLLNHSDDFELDSIYVDADWLLDWYGIQPPAAMTSFATGTSIVTAIDDRIFRDGTPVEDISPPLVGAMHHDGVFVVASVTGLSLYDNDWQLIERLDAATILSAPIAALGRTPDGRIVIESGSGERVASEDFLRWQLIDADDVDWSVESPTPEQLVSDLKTSYRGQGLSLERVMLDLHSGRIAGKSGVYLVDAAALLFFVLAVSGVWLWARRRRKVGASAQK